MKKQGFTLVELLVVIVIMGILSAVAVPKLFGMIAKSKAAELYPAAKTYIKLQDAYVGERHQIGSWSLIGYIGPGSIVSGAADRDSSSSSNFNYGGGSYRGTSGFAVLGGAAVTAKVGWVAVNKAALNEIPIGSRWTISVGAAVSQGLISYSASMPTNAGSLTPNFMNLSH